MIMIMITIIIMMITLIDAIMKIAQLKLEVLRVSLRRMRCMQSVHLAATISSVELPVSPSATSAHGWMHGCMAEWVDDATLTGFDAVRLQSLPHLGAIAASWSRFWPTSPAK